MTRGFARVFSYLYDDHSKCFFILSYPGCVAKCARILHLDGMADFRPILGPLTPKWYNVPFPSFMAQYGQIPEK